MSRRHHGGRPHRFNGPSRPIDTSRRFDNWYQVDTALRQAAFALQLSHQPVYRCEPGSAFDLRQNDAIETGPDDRNQIGVAELGIEGVDPDIQQPAARPTSTAR